MMMILTFLLVRFMTQKYERIVLRPEINNSELQSAYLQCVKVILIKENFKF